VILVLAGSGEKKSNKLKPFHFGSLFFGIDAGMENASVPAIKAVVRIPVCLMKERRCIQL
jgi:hypothetical protein